MRVILRRQAIYPTALGMLIATSSTMAMSSVTASENHGPIYRTLDALAGGIEKVLGLSATQRASWCDQESCDDGCDAITAMQLEMPLPPIHRPANPPMPPSDFRVTPPSMVPTPPPMMPQAADDDWLDGFSPPIEGTPMRPQPSPVPMPQTVNPYDALPNPFMDDPQSRRTPQKNIHRPVQRATFRR